MTGLFNLTVGPSDLFAYLDGGTGSLVLQALLGGVLTAGYVVKTQWSAVKAKLSSLGKPRLP